MDPGLRRAWTEVVTADDYDLHMANIGQAQAAAGLTRKLLESAGKHVVFVGAGTGQMFDYIDAEVLRRFELTFTDLNPRYLARLQTRLDRLGLNATVLEDDIEQTALEPGADLLIATLLLEHIDWRRGVEVIAGLRPAACGIIIQENPPGMATAVTPGRVVPRSIAEAVEFAHPTLVPREQLSAAFEQ